MAFRGYVMNEESVITEIKGIGEKNAKLYEKAGIKTVGELLRHYPKGYERFEEIKPIAGVRRLLCMVLSMVL